MTLIPDQLRRLAGRHPQEVAFTVAGPGAGELTLGEWNSASARFGRGLVARGVAPGDRVALLLAPADALRFVVAYAATHKAGAVAVPVNVRQSAAEVGAILRHCEPSAVVVGAALHERLAAELAACPSVRTVVVAGDGEAAGALAWDAVPLGDDTDLQVPREEDDLAEILYTSGTTGRPKGVAIRHGNSALTLLADPAWSGRPWLHASPLFTFAGLTFVYQPMRMGLRTLYQSRFDTAEWLRLVEAERPCGAFLVPSMVQLLLGEKALATADLSSLQLVSVGSAPVAPATLEAFAARLPGATVANSYSMTEAGTAYFVMPAGEGERHPGAVGRPLPPAQVRVVDRAGQDCRAGEVGDILLKAAGRPRAYYRDPEATAGVFGADGWLRTGDLGRVDEDGYLYVVGRDKDVIIRGGYNVYATDVEATLYEHPRVREAAVVGVSHPVLGEDVAAFVVAAPETTADELAAHCRSRLADYKVPRRFVFCAQLPRNATGKVLKRQLRLD